MLDADRLGFIAARLQSLLASQTQLRTTTEIAARHRVFAGVLRATGENLSIVQRVACGATEEQLWVR